MAKQATTRRFGPWDVASDAGGIKLEIRKNQDSGILETRVAGIVNAPTDQVWKTITTPVTYLAVMPRTVESVHLDEGPKKKSLHCYQRLSGKPSADRDYTLSVSWTTEKTKDGTRYHRSWTVANGEGPPPKPGVVRVEVSDGSWILEPLAGKRTHLTQESYIELGGSLLKIIANSAVKDSAILLLRSLHVKFPG